MTYSEQDKYTSKELLSIWNNQNKNKQWAISALPMFRFYLDQGMLEFKKIPVIQTHPLFVNGFINKVVA